jgi:Protein of unknown function (DUF4239)
MSSLETAGVVFAGVFGSAILAMVAGRFLPVGHLNGESKDVVKLGLGVIATLTALVLGLLVASAKGNYDTQSSSVKQLAANARLLNRLLGRYGPETDGARKLLQSVVVLTLESLWPEDNPPKTQTSVIAARDEMEALYDNVGGLEPKTDAQRVIKGRALDLLTEMAQLRLRLATNKDSSIPLPFLVVLILWLVVLFAGYGLLAPRNATVVVVLFICALSFSAALFLVLELDRPFDGVVRVSSAPVRESLSLLGK